jgi:acyl-CoA synthetase (AMP-forming)/AMP-acid ligase II
VRRTPLGNVRITPPTRKGRHRRVRAQRVDGDVVPSTPPSARQGRAFAPGEFFTADLGSFATRGQLQLGGPRARVVNVGGRKVYPAEIERVIREVPGVLDVVVSGVARSSVADALRAVVAADVHVSREDIAAACEQRLARYKVPRSIEIVRELPRTGRGKVDRRGLDARYPIG